MKSSGRTEKMSLWIKQPSLTLCGFFSSSHGGIKADPGDAAIEKRISNKTHLQIKLPNTKITFDTVKHMFFTVKQQKFTLQLCAKNTLPKAQTYRVWFMSL